MCVCENESEREIWNLHHIYHHLHHHTTAPEWLVLGTVFTHIPPPPPPPPPPLPNPPHSHSQATSRGAMGRSAWRREIEEQKEKWDETSHTSRKGNGVGGQCEDGGGGCAHIVTLNPAVGLETHTNCLVTQPQNIATGRRRTAPGEALRILSNHSALLRECASWGCRLTSSLVSRFKISAVAMLFLSRCI